MIALAARPPVPLSAPEPPRIDPARLRPCPFCGGAPALEQDPWLGESFRIGCGNDACRVAPKTEYLLPGYADELCDAWNARDGGTGERG
ncbi:MAG: hypothetical protein AB1941_04805 [Gemmatimonadota bacterium]